MSRKQMIYVLTSLAFIILVLFYTMKRKNSNSWPLNVTIAEAQQSVFGLIYIAEDLGYFKENGLKVNYRKFKSGKRALQDMIDGNSDFATSFETPIILKTIEGIDLSIYSSLHFSEKNSALVVRQDRGIQSVKDLAGKKIGLTLGTNMEYMLSVYLEKEGIKPHRVKTVGLKPSELPDQLQKGHVDAILTWQPHIHHAQKLLGPEKSKILYLDGYLDSSALVGLKIHEKENYKKILQILKALKSAEEFYKNNRKKSLEIVLKYLPSEFHEGEKISWTFSSCQLGLSKKVFSLYENQMNWFIKKLRKNAKVQRIREQFSPKAFEEVYSESVSL